MFALTLNTVALRLCGNLHFDKLNIQFPAKPQSRKENAKKNAGRFSTPPSISLKCRKQEFRQKAKRHHSKRAFRVSSAEPYRRIVRQVRSRRVIAARGYISRQNLRRSAHDIRGGRGPV